MSSELPPPLAVLFDFDGTLVNTMPLHYEAYRNVFADMGVELTREDFFPNAGGKASETIPRFLHGRHSPLTVSEIHHLKKERIKTVFATEAVEECVDAVHAGPCVLKFWALQASKWARDSPGSARGRSVSRSRN